MYGGRDTVHSSAYTQLTSHAHALRSRRCWRRRHRSRCRGHRRRRCRVVLVELNMGVVVVVVVSYANVFESFALHKTFAILCASCDREPLGPDTNAMIPSLVPSTCAGGESGGRPASVRSPPSRWREDARKVDRSQVAPRRPHFHPSICPSILIIRNQPRIEKKGKVSFAVPCGRSVPSPHHRSACCSCVTLRVLFGRLRPCPHRAAESYNGYFILLGPENFGVFVLPTRSQPAEPINRPLRKQPLNASRSVRRNRSGFEERVRGIFQFSFICFFLPRGESLLQRGIDETFATMENY